MSPCISWVKLSPVCGWETNVQPVSDTSRTSFGPLPSCRCGTGVPPGPR
ncbi:hypothetical protein ACNF49_39840 [Actinomadura sp. ATCC 39365]